MQLGNDCVVDASRCGNPSRFINHSCDPNCELQRWYVGDEIRIGIFAIKDIEKGNVIIIFDLPLLHPSPSFFFLLIFCLINPSHIFFSFDSFSF